MIKFEQLTNRHLYFIAACLSLLLSAWIGLRESVINPDAICYVLSAQSITAHNLSYAMHLCGQAQWPFYSWLIYAMASVTHVSYPLAAYGVDALLTMTTVVTFMAIVARLGGNRTVLVFAAFVILLHHDFNSVKQYIIRDHGYWACYLVSLYALLRFCQLPAWRYAILFNSSLALATMFRLEGMVFFLAAPFLILLISHYSFKQRLYYWLKLESLCLVLGMVALLWILSHPQASLLHFGRVPEWQREFSQGLSILYSRFIVAKQHLATYVLPYDSYHEAGKLMAVLLISWYVLSVVTNLTLPYSCLVIYAWLVKRIVWPRSGRLIVGGYLLINVLITFVFLTQHFFLTKRYLLALSLTLMLYVPFALRHLFAARRTHHMRITWYVVLVAIAIASAGGIIDFGYSKAYIHDAGVWVDKHVPKSAKLYANDIQFMYYANHYGDNIFVRADEFTKQAGPISAFTPAHWRQYDYVALRIDQKQAEQITPIIAKMQLQPIQHFSNKRGDRVVIYQVAH